MSKSRILLVEDDRALREALADTLALGGYDYLEAADGEAALTLLQRESVAMVVSDVNMPGMDGHALLRTLRERFPQLPVLLMTAYGTVQNAVVAVRDGAVDYLVKRSSPRHCLIWSPSTPSAACAPVPTVRWQWTRPASSCCIWPSVWPPAIRRYCFPASPAPARRCWRAISISTHPGPLSRSLPSTAQPFRRTCWRRPCSVTRRAPSPELSPPSPASSSRPTAAPCCWTRYRKCPWRCRPSCCVYCRSARWSG